MKRYCLIILFLAQLTLLPAKGFSLNGILAIDISCRTTSMPNKIIVHIDLLRDYIGPAAPNYLSLNAIDTMQGVFNYFHFDSIPHLSFTNAALPSCNILMFQNELHAYEDTIVLPYPSAQWILFLNTKVSASMFGILEPSLTIKTEINTLLNLTNHTPSFVSPFDYIHCLGVAHTFYNNAVDVDGDSLSYQLIPIQTFDSTFGFVDLVYPAPYTPVNFTYSSSIPFFDSLIGSYNYTPNVLSITTMYLLVEEYRSGVKIGATTRLMNFRIVNGTVSLQDSFFEDGINWKVFPSPTSGKANVIFNENLYVMNYSIVDMQGNMVVNKEIGKHVNSLIISLDVLNAGFYFLCIDSDLGKKTISIVRIN